MVWVGEIGVWSLEWGVGSGEVGGSLRSLRVEEFKGLRV